MSEIKISVITSLYNCKNYIKGYLEALQRVTNITEIEVLLLHNDPKDDETAVIADYLRELSCIRHIIIPQREGLYATWNRGIELSRGKYLAIWNVDDIRTPDSLENQAKALEDNPEAAMAYGDIIETSSFGNREGVLRKHPEYQTNKNEFLRSHLIGCFPMWRKDIHRTVGFFDEQFRIASDFEFQIRVARQFPLVKATNMLGYYLGTSGGNTHKLSSSQNLNTERTAVEVRYGQFDKIDLTYLHKALTHYDLFHLYLKGAKYSVAQLFPQYKSFLLSRLHLIGLSIIALPFNTARRVRNKFRHHIS